MQGEEKPKEEIKEEKPTEEIKDEQKPLEIETIFQEVKPINEDNINKEPTT